MKPQHLNNRVNTNIQWKNRLTYILYIIMHISIFDHVGIEFFFFTKRMVFYFFYVKWTRSHIVCIYTYCGFNILFDILLRVLVQRTNEKNVYCNVPSSFYNNKYKYVMYH